MRRELPRRRSGPHVDRRRAERDRAPTKRELLEMVGEEEEEEGEGGER